MTANINTYGMNVLNYAAAEQAMFTNMMANELCYKTISTFWQDLSIAEVYGPDAVKDTYERVLKAWGNNTEMFTEFVMALNHKSWEHHARKQYEMSELYADLYHGADDYVYSNWDKERRGYYYSMTD